MKRSTLVSVWKVLLFSLVRLITWRSLSSDRWFISFDLSIVSKFFHFLLHPFVFFSLDIPFSSSVFLFLFLKHLLLINCSVDHLLSSLLFRWNMRVRWSICTVAVSEIIFPGHSDSLGPTCGASQGWIKSLASGETVRTVSLPVNSTFGAQIDSNEKQHNLIEEALTFFVISCCVIWVCGFLLCVWGRQILFPFASVSVRLTFPPAFKWTVTQPEGHRENKEFVCVCVCVLEAGEATGVGRCVDSGRASPCVVHSIFSEVTGEPARMMTKCLCAALDTRWQNRQGPEWWT